MVTSQLVALVKSAGQLIANFKSQLVNSSPNVVTMSLFILLYLKLFITRLLGRPQPQMYPPVALNQYTWVNRTHKHFIYGSRPHKHFKIDFTQKLSSQQHVKYKSNLMNIFYSFWGGGGVLGKDTSMLNNQTVSILVHIYPLFNNNLHVKYRSNLIRTF